MNTLIKNNYINKNGFYVIDESSPSIIDILPGIQAKILLINSKKPLTFNLEEGAMLDFYGFFYESSPVKILFHQNEAKSKLCISTLFYNDIISLKSQIKSYVNADFCETQIKIYGLIEKQQLSIDSVIEIEKGVQGVKAHLDIENVFIGEDGSVSSIPTLLVRSDDIEASHSSKTHRFDEHKLFYLTSRGISLKESMDCLIESYFIKTFEGLKNEKHHFQNLFEKFSFLRK